MPPDRVFPFYSFSIAFRVVAVVAAAAAAAAVAEFRFLSIAFVCVCVCVEGGRWRRDFGERGESRAGEKTIGFGLTTLHSLDHEGMLHSCTGTHHRDRPLAANAIDSAVGSCAWL